MLVVKVKDGKIENALKVLKKKVRNTKQQQELRDRQEFTKKSVKKRDEKSKAAHIQRKRNEEN